MTPRPEDSIFNIYINGELQATGVVVGKGKVVTCLHVIDELFQHKNFLEFDSSEDPGRLSVEAGRGRDRLPARILRGNQHHDLCLLSVHGLDAPYLEIAQAHESKQGDEVFSLARPGGKLLGGKGTMVGLNQLKSAEAPLLLNDAPSIYGSSGGALLNNKDQLIGVQSLRGAALPAIWLEELLKRKDEKIVSREVNPETEVDYYFTAISAATAFRSSHAPFVKWVIDRPESRFAARSFMAYCRAHDLGKEHNIRLEDREKAVAILAAHSPVLESDYSKLCEKLADLDFSNKPLREKYLLQAIDLAEDKSRRALLYRSLGDMYLEAAQPAEAEKSFMAVTDLLHEQGDNQFAVRRAAFANLSSLYLGRGDKTRAHKAFLQAFEMDCRDFKSNSGFVSTDDYMHIFNNNVEFVEMLGARNKKLFEGDFEEQQVFRKCMQQVSAHYPEGKSAHLGG